MYCVFCCFYNLLPTTYSLTMNISYTVSPFLKEELQAIEEARDKVLLHLLSPEQERRLIWEAKIDRTYYMLGAEDKKIRKNRLEQIFRETTPKRSLPEVEENAFRYKLALDYIEQNWTFEQTHVKEREIKRLQLILENSQPQRIRDIKTTLEFIQSTPEHPVIQAALAYEMLLTFVEEEELAKRLATLSAYIFLFRGGFDLKRQLVLEEYFVKSGQNNRETALSAMQSGNLSPFLDHFVNAMRIQVSIAYTKRKEVGNDTTPTKALFKLNDRQKQILTILEEPGSRLSNKNVQKLYDISQVTASRDLAKLVDLGLIRPHGKGRSVHYTISNG